MQFTFCSEVYAHIPRKKCTNKYKFVQVLAYITIKWVILVYEYI